MLVAMTLWKRGNQLWMDVTVKGRRHREPLNTHDRALARQREKERVAELLKDTEPAAPRRELVTLSVKAAIEAYVADRQHEVSPRMVAWWLENSKPLGKYFGGVKLKDLWPADLKAYQQARQRAPKTVNGELATLRQVLKAAKLWGRFASEYRPVRNVKPPVGQALTDDEAARLFAVARSNPQWLPAYVAATLAFYCGLRACEIRGLRWKHVDWEHQRLQIRRSKTPAGWRDPALNVACLNALRLLPKGGPEDSIMPFRSWRGGWDALRKAAGIKVRFHDGRHTALTRLAEAGQPDWVIQAQLGHVSPAMMRVYSHIRRRALEDAAAALQPPQARHSFTSQFPEKLGVIKRFPPATLRLTAGCSAVELPRNAGKPATNAGLPDSEES
jgi:integrase